MGEPLKSEETIREYLLGRVSDEATLEGLEELLFTDEEFCSRVALAEDGLINDYAFGTLNHEDAESFRATLASDPERLRNLELTEALREKALARNLSKAKLKPSYFSSIILFFRQPVYAGAFAVLLIAAVVLGIYFSRRSNTDDLAELKSIYKQARPTESRISEFDYAPLSQLRGAPDTGNEKRLRRIENNLIEATEKTSNAETHHALGRFWLTQHKYPDAIKELEAALKFAPQNARIHNDLGAVYFEVAKASPEGKRFEPLSHAFEEFTRATQLDGNLLEALFNKALAQQELAPRQARESWLLYLQKDPSSPWAEEARRNLAWIEKERALSRKPEEILADFLIAYRNHDEPRAQRIHNETKGVLTSSALTLQLSRRYLGAKKSGDNAEAKESLDALTYIGRFEQAENSEFFFLS